MVHSSWLKAHGSCLKARGSGLMAKKQLALGPPGPGPQRQIFSAISHEPWATSLEAWAMSFEPWTINHPLTKKINRKNHGKKLRWESVRWLVIGITLSENRKMVRFCEKSIHVFWSKLKSYSRFWRNSAGKINVRRFLVFDFSWFQDFITSNYHDFKNSKFQKFKKWVPTCSDFSKFLMLILP